MSRPHNETPVDVYNEAVAREFIAANRPGWERWFAMPTQSNSGADFDMHDEQGCLRCRVEVKVRAARWKQYETLLISRAKLATLARKSARDGVPVWIAAGWRDGVGMISLEDYLGKATTKDGSKRVLDPLNSFLVDGRRDRDQDGDLERLVYVPVEHFEFMPVRLPFRSTANNNGVTAARAA